MRRGRACTGRRRPWPCRRPGTHRPGEAWRPGSRDQPGRADARGRPVPARRTGPPQRHPRLPGTRRRTLVEVGEGARVAGSVRPLAAPRRLTQDRERFPCFAGGRQRTAEADPGGDGGRVDRTEHTVPAVEDPSRAAHGVGCLPRRQQRVRELPGRDQRVRMVGAEQSFAAGLDLPPPGDRRPGQPRGGRALPGRQQHPVAAAVGPQRIAGVTQQACRARPHLGGLVGAGLILRPRLAVPRRLPPAIARSSSSGGATARTDACNGVLTQAAGSLAGPMETSPARSRASAAFHACWGSAGTRRPCRRGTCRWRGR